ncbi:hypothetical protein [Eubacterium xylanophilum]|uniref:hypothetical protein n=1 Tax=Eubacterium xylanophilum TaxID=39497 RepID=UPI00047D3E86|nr:hypothetical protein [Eubacterium xylanophilum]
MKKYKFDLIASFLAILGLLIIIVVTIALSRLSVNLHDIKTHEMVNASMDSEEEMYKNVDYELRGEPRDTIIKLEECFKPAAEMDSEEEDDEEPDSNQIMDDLKAGSIPDDIRRDSVVIGRKNAISVHTDVIYNVSTKAFDDKLLIDSMEKAGIKDATNQIKKLENVLVQWVEYGRKLNEDDEWEKSEPTNISLYCDGMDIYINKDDDFRSNKVVFGFTIFSNMNNYLIPTQYKHLVNEIEEKTPYKLYSSAIKTDNKYLVFRKDNSIYASIHGESDFYDKLDNNVMFTLKLRDGKVSDCQVYSIFNQVKLEDADKLFLELATGKKDYDISKIDSTDVYNIFKVE